MSTAAARRYAAIDLVKGLAILGVLLIHSEALGDSRVFYYLVNRAVPVFIVLFGVNSELWWRRHAFPADLGSWFRGRARRILVPMWAALPVWWALAAWLRPPSVRLSATLLVLQVYGYMSQIGTGWFITTILQLVVVFPFLHALARRVGTGLVLALGVAVTLASTAAYLRIIWLFGGFNYFVFSPRFLAHVAFGLWLSSRLERLGWAAAVASATALVFCLAIQEKLVAPGLALYAEPLMDLPLTVLLLVAVRPLERVPALGPALVWLGLRSYGIYLGQLLTHNAFVFDLWYPRLFATGVRWLYTGALLAGGVGAVLLGDALLRALDAFRRDRVALPTPAR